MPPKGPQELRFASRAPSAGGFLRPGKQPRASPTRHRPDLKAPSAWHRRAGESAKEDSGADARDRGKTAFPVSGLCQAHRIPRRPAQNRDSLAGCEPAKRPAAPAPAQTQQAVVEPARCMASNLGRQLAFWPWQAFERGGRHLKHGANRPGVDSATFDFGLGQGGGVAEDHPGYVCWLLPLPEHTV